MNSCFLCDEIIKGIRLDEKQHVGAKRQLYERHDEINPGNLPQVVSDT